jgi:hypothetical protein
VAAAAQAQSSSFALKQYETTSGYVYYVSKNALVNNDPVQFIIDFEVGATSTWTAAAQPSKKAFLTTPALVFKAAFDPGSQNILAFAQLAEEGATFCGNAIYFRHTPAACSSDTFAAVACDTNTCMLHGKEQDGAPIPVTLVLDAKTPCEKVVSVSTSTGWHSVCTTEAHEVSLDAAGAALHADKTGRYSVYFAARAETSTEEFVLVIISLAVMMVWTNEIRRLKKGGWIKASENTEQDAPILYAPNTQKLADIDPDATRKTNATFKWRTTQTTCAISSQKEPVPLADVWELEPEADVKQQVTIAMASSDAVVTIAFTAAYATTRTGVALVPTQVSTHVQWAEPAVLAAFMATTAAAACTATALLCELPAIIRPGYKKKIARKARALVETTFLNVMFFFMPNMAGEALRETLGIFMGVAVCIIVARDINWHTTFIFGPKQRATQAGYTLLFATWAIAVYGIAIVAQIAPVFVESAGISNSNAMLVGIVVATGAAAAGTYASNHG